MRSQQNSLLRIMATDTISSSANLHMIAAQLMTLLIAMWNGIRKTDIKVAKRGVHFALSPAFMRTFSRSDTSAQP
ncbi:MAG: hypothetical protein VXZ82_09540 [Planctomycetota bacterium]|nr:hypothetical protein [Planctomycetota bacterium]